MCDRIQKTLSQTKEKYREAVGLYGSTVLSVRAICARCGVSYAGLRSYLYKYRRDLLLSRHGVAVPPVSDAAHTRLRGRRGQTAAARAKYGDAIAACGDAKYIEYNVSQIAHLFGMNPTGLSNQLRAHCPGLLERRERERQRLGLADNQQRGVRPWCREQYAAAVELLRTTEMTVAEVAERCGVSFTGLRQHVCFYHKDLQQRRSELRERAKTQKRKGHVTGSGRRHEPTAGSRERYREAVRLYREYYGETGLFENELIPGTVEFLTELKRRGKRVCLATSKPEKFSVRILEKFGVDKYFDFIGAASFDSSRSSKLAVIQYVLENTGAKPEECLMVGDRMHDIVGAHDAGIKCAAVLVGFGSRGEFAEYGADYVCETLDDVLKLV